ncbi:MAG: molybdopterin biosynthesis protein [Methanospirillum sp.]|uniref:molybdopterin biosynthesis protein n=1 Tax=Methanospirillum sp. TaxID=45200 RepID=UPI0023709781|nr:molybdopterin biosynthesis protein [Methanospirillum sp.]MDD1727660.1 molybdopterin biosynthesis protein [Methanospirillum sp.]
MVREENGSTRYLTLTSLADVLSELHDRFSYTPRTVRIPVQNSYGKITAEAVFSPLSVPVAHLSAMDGIAVKTEYTIGATDQKPVILTDAVRVNTGNVIPDGYDAVIMIEDVEEQAGSFQIRSSAHPWQHIRPVGEDIAVTEMVIPRFSRIRAVDIGAMASYGVSEVAVLDLRVALIPTGSEIVPVGTMPRPGQVIESNMHMAGTLITAAGASVTHYPVVPDDQDQIRAVVQEAVVDHDIVLISAGSSKGTKDYTARIIADLGTVFIHGVAIKPAKPVILGEIENRPVIGMPGYPIACHTILREILLPMLGWYGLPILEPEVIQVQLTCAIQSAIGTDEFVLATVGKIQDHWIAAPLSRGSGIQMSMVRSNAYLKIPADQEGLETGSLTTAVLTVPKQSAGQVVLITGSHDPAIDHLADLIRGCGILIASSHVGSMGGLLTLKRGDCHLAPMHLLADDGEYNIPYLQKYFPDEELVLICVAEREQGIVSREGLGFEAITTHQYINRQRGSGTRMLLDHMLRQKGIDPDGIAGYNREVTTHLGVCLAVQSGDADLGMAVYSAAKAFSLPFVPVGVERYELVTTRKMFDEDSRIRAIADMIASQKCKNILEKLGGYRTGETGHIRRCNQR